MSRRGGTMTLKVDGTQRDAKGNFTYNFGQPKRESMILADNTNAGFKETGQVPFIEGEIVDSKDLKALDFLNIRGATIILAVPNDKTVVLREAHYAGDGNFQTEEGNIEVRFEGIQMEEV
jgi:hypothetical protein